MRVEKPNSAVHENECFYIVMLAPCKSTTTRNSHFTFRFSNLVQKAQKVNYFYLYHKYSKNLNLH